MLINNISRNYKDCKSNIPDNVSIIAVSKTYGNDKILDVYNENHLDFGENKVQELVSKYEDLPKDIRWHQIGHLQTNKVKYIINFIHLIHSVDSKKLLETIQKEAEKSNKIINVLLQIKIAKEETKYGLTFEEAFVLLINYKNKAYPNVKILGFMGMASFVDDKTQLRQEFSYLSEFYNKNKSIHDLSVLSMGMSHDYKLAIDCGSNMVRIGTNIFGERNYD